MNLAQHDSGLSIQLQRIQARWRRDRPDFDQRIDMLKRLEQQILALRREIVEAISTDFGQRSEVETLGADILVTLEEIRHVRKNLRAWMRPQRRAISPLFWPARGELRMQALGVIGIVAPWNYPFQLALIPLIDAIGAGNYVMLKPSEHTPNTSAVIAKLINKVFADDQVLTVQGDAQVGAEFTALPFDHLVFTGSTAVGRLVAKAAAPNLTPTTLELGGKSPVLIAPDYPIKQAANRVAAGKSLNSGQTCIAPDYVLVHESQLDQFVSEYLRQIEQRYPDPVNNPDITNIINEAQRQRLQSYLDEAERSGADVRQPKNAEQWVQRPRGIVPSVLINPPDTLRVSCEEIFGPVLIVKSYQTMDEALTFIESGDRPLAFYPFDQNPGRLHNSLNRIVAGSVLVNDTIFQFGQHELPVGGVGASGMGHYHGHLGFMQFSKQMPVMYQPRWNFAGLMDAPFSPLLKRALRWLTR